jgi:hypothetical protein
MTEQTTRRLSRLLLKSIVIAQLSLLMVAANASTVLQVGVADMLDNSELVIHGHVIDRWTNLDSKRNTVFTNVRIIVDDVIKGSTTRDEIVLKFEGGTYGRQSVSIGGMNLPIVGEEGVYFIERPDRVQINPLYGWQQGHFVVRHSSDGKNKMIYTFDLRSIYAVEPVTRGSAVSFSAGVPLGISTNPEANENPKTLSSFKQALRALTEVQQ